MSTATHSVADDNGDPYQTSSQLEIVRLLRSIEARKALLRMHLKGRAVAIVTTILEVDAANHRLIVDVSSDPDFNERIIKAQSVTFDTMLDKIHIQFSTTDITPCLQDNLPALSMPIPQTLSRIQRREYYRVDTPVTHPASCKIPIKGEHGTIEHSLIVKDISAGGVSLVDADHILDNSKGATYKHCKLELPEVGSVVTELRVMRSQDESLANDVERRVIGCKFVNLPNPMQIMVQHYIGLLERKLNAKRRGFD
ncbi:flagellar regulator YcgR PilZN domain-containing protein [Pusillimonas sp. SM2304]|uniref:flagellar brake protein n=1 Tax=Pusillimonas sp. SM2304 TaxID=3073241 RepID=UPI002876CFFB|nr:flagellar regulator YcgR PilZN domain-containing protein [Pusillimonas sp. SM2304]MDS1140493.1 flagellar regulator YcgR PilZN domain-containing protein [Pusillimonas sp. SM2304]